MSDLSAMKMKIKQKEMRELEAIERKKRLLKEKELKKKEMLKKMQEDEAKRKELL